MTSKAKVERALREKSDPVKAAFFPKFFKTGPGEYGEGDKFIGVVVPEQRRIAKKFRDLKRDEVKKLLDSPFHECRLTGLLILVEQMQAAKNDKAAQKECVDFYLDNLDQVNNWDLVDSSAHKILGVYVLENAKQRKLLRKLSRSDTMWHQRVSVIATLPLTKAGEFDELLWLAKKLLAHPHDLMHKAIGWMLREAGKVDIAVLRGFLDTHASQMPRTMLRYSIEKLDKNERARWMAITPNN
ncbi:MAG: DNA alkylation repair protein [Aureliella sp.]